MNKNSRSGFLLFEAVIYLALLSFILGSAFVSAYSLIDSSERMTESAFSEEEGNFLMSKIARATEDARTIIIPTSSATTSTLSLDVLLLNPVIFDVSSGTARIKKNGFGFVPVTSGNFFVSNIGFVRTTGSGSRPDSLLASYDIGNKHFSRIIYLNN